MINWEGAELCYYVDGESIAISLSDTQFAILVKLLGLENNSDGSVSCYSDETLKMFNNLDGNPLKMQIIKGKGSLHA